MTCSCAPAFAGAQPLMQHGAHAGLKTHAQPTVALRLDKP